MVLCHVCEECALRDPTSFGHLLRDPVANNGARCTGCPLYFCYRHLYLNHDGAMCQRAKQFFMHDEPITSTHALIAHWLACVPLRGDHENGSVDFCAPGQDAIYPATTRPRDRRRVRFARDVEEIPPRPEESIWKGVAYDVVKFLATVIFVLIAMIPIRIMLAQMEKLLELFRTMDGEGEL
ncbi:hypothetical protein BJX68DRAFT_267985 [Aspergillus pseudodeflectus]|uniref:Uncharacterized protein n=1 Tax=Aspergillus pseudodeflectus TaxID=176178 RepID=A0ABR4K5J9_9EURO